MNILQRINAAYRAFVLGSATVNQSDMAWGHSGQDYSPAEYGTYIATSNGVYACSTLRAQLLSALPLRLYRTNAKGDKALISNGPLYDLLSLVNPFWTFNRLVEMTELSLGLWGEAFWFLERGTNARRAPVEIWWGRPDRVKPIPHPQNYISGFLYDVPGTLQPIAFLPDEVIWFRYPNPLDEYEGLSPIAAARLAADVGSATLKSKRNFFTNGMQAGGFVKPPSGQTLNDEQAKDLELALERRFKGIDKAHRWGVFKFDAQVTPLTNSMKDAEGIDTLHFTLEDIARAYKVPLDLIGGQRTYENVDAARKIMYEQCVIPESRFIASELQEQLLPMFGGQADVVEFDTSGISVLGENESAEWDRAQGQIQAGAITINEWRTEQGLQPVPWGNTWWAPSNLLPVDSGAVSATTPAAPRLLAPPQHRAIDYGSDEHQRLFDQFVTRTAPGEKKLGNTVAELFKRQRDQILDKVNAQRVLGATEAYSTRDMGDIADNPFDLEAWVKTFRQEAKPVIRDIILDNGNAAMDDLGISMAFDVTEPLVQDFLANRAQRFAEFVNETTWDSLKKSLNDGIGKGESISELADRVQAIMEGRIRSSKEVIARTETIGASNGGTLLAWKQSDVVESKQWLAALDDRTRDTHRTAHGQTVALDADFKVGDATGPAPGQMGEAGEDCNCRCSMIAILKERATLEMIHAILETASRTLA